MAAASANFVMLGILVPPGWTVACPAPYRQIGTAIDDANSPQALLRGLHSSRRRTRRCGRSSERVLPIRPRYRGGGLLLRRLGRELRAAHAQPAARVLPQLFRGVQMADGAGGGGVIVARDFFRDVGEGGRRLAR